MLFNSTDFIFLFGLVCLLYWIIPQKFRWFLLLVTSYLFYMSWEPIYIVLILFSTSIDYFLCRFLTGSEVLKKRKIGLALSIILNLGLLVVFKYYNFFQDTFVDLLNVFDIHYEGNKSTLLLPIGISFYTFQTMSYSIDVYRKNFRIEKHFGKFALYVSFFPQIIAGPIERASHLLHQLNKKELAFRISNLKDGLLLFIWGLFKKVVVADNLRVLVDHVFNNENHQNSGSILFALFAFTVQLYADFSGYSDMAIGTSKMLGINLNINFRTPYFSKSITEFWRRWHITLSTWLRDYVFFPLGGSQVSNVITLRNILIVFLLSGLWHGASWNFIIWGGVHGVIVVIEKIMKRDREIKNHFFRITRIFFTFIIIVFTMLPFRATNFNQLKALTIKLFDFKFYDLYIAIAEVMHTPGMVGLVVLFFTDLILARYSILGLNKFQWSIKITWLTLITVLIFLLGDSASESFLYFQF